MCRVILVNLFTFQDTVSAHLATLYKLTYHISHGMSKSCKGVFFEQVALVINMDTAVTTIAVGFLFKQSSYLLCFIYN